MAAHFKAASETDGGVWVMSLKHSILLFISVFLIVLFISTPTVTAQDNARLERFKECIKRCSQMNSLCNEEVKDLWLNYHRNTKKILTHLRKCCLRGATRSDASPEDSFATCARLRCGAMLWG